MKKGSGDNIHVLDLILVVICALVVCYTVVMIVCFWKFQAIPDTLTTCVFGCAVGELGISGFIKVKTLAKVKMKLQKDLVDLEITRLRQIAEMKKQYGDSLPPEILQAMQYTSIDS